MSKVHLLAGPNNSGKSNALRVLGRVLPVLRSDSKLDLDDVDVPQRRDGSDPPPMRFAVYHRRDSINLSQGGNRGRLDTARVVSLLEGETFSAGDDAWLAFQFELQRDSRGAATGWVPAESQVMDLHLAGGGDPQRANSAELARVSSQLTGQSGGKPGDDARRVLTAVIKSGQVRRQLPKVATIDAFRQIGPATDGRVISGEHNGPGLIDRLAQLQNPGFARPGDQDRFEAINRFLRTLFEDEGTSLEIPYDRDTILIRHAGRRLPLENYGTGVHQVVILAAAATTLSGFLVCMEEPEIHLHPTLQRKLLRYLSDETDNQYLIATHSAHLLDTGRASISRVQLRDGATRTSAAITPRSVSEISTELGFRASDLVQANAVVWVEGPSDRVYIESWLKQADAELVEGVHYLTMFYGGALLAHLSPHDPAVDGFVSLPRINRNFAVVIDSDRRRRGGWISPTKRRIRHEVEARSPNSRVWVTGDYTIENYVPAAVLREAVSAVHPKATCLWQGKRYESPLASHNIKGRQSAVDKSAIAREVVKRWSDSDSLPLDARQEIKALVRLVRRANDLPT